MHVVVVGCGRVGSEIAGTLEQQGHTVSIIDKRKDAFRRLPKGFAGNRIVGFGFDRDTLAEAGIGEAGALASVTSGDNSNIMSARVARETFGVERVVARIYDPRRAAIYQRLGIPTVATVTWATMQVRRWLLNEDETIAWTADSGKLSLIERFLPDSLAGQPLTQLNAGNDIRVVGVVRGGGGRLDIEELYGQEDDKVYFLVTPDGAKQLNGVLGIESK